MSATAVTAGNVPAVAPTVLVLGAGELGVPVTRALARRATGARSGSVNVLLRPSSITASSPDKQAYVAELRRLDVGIVPGDVAAASVAELAELFRPFDTVVSCIGFASGPGMQLKLARAALGAEVRRYVPWQFGVDYDVIGRGSAQELFDEQLDVRDLLRAQRRTEWVIVSTGIFVGFLFEPSFGVVDLAHRTVRALGSWDNAVTVTAPHDIGELTAEILATEPRIVDEVVHIAGDTITYAQLADIVEAVTGHEVRRVAWPIPTLRSELAEDLDDPMRKYRAVFGAGRGVAWDPRSTFNASHDLPVTDVATWAAENLGAP